MNDNDRRRIKEVKDAYDDFKSYLVSMQRFCEESSDSDFNKGCSAAFGYAIEYCEKILERTQYLKPDERGIRKWLKDLQQKTLTE